MFWVLALLCESSNPPTFIQLKIFSSVHLREHQHFNHSFFRIPFLMTFCQKGFVFFLYRSSSIWNGSLLDDLWPVWYTVRSRHWEETRSRPGADGVDSWVGSQQRDAVMDAREGRLVMVLFLGWRGSRWRTVTVGRGGRGTVTVGRGGRGTVSMGREDRNIVWRNWLTNGLLLTRT